MTRLEKLKKLEDDLNGLMEKANSRVYASLAKQYREVIREIDEIEGGNDTDNEIEQIIEKRKADGRAGAVRKDRAKVSEK